MCANPQSDPAYDTPRRRSIRLRDYDYSQAGAYFVTICAYNRTCLFGEIADGEMRLNPIGEIVVEEWTKSERVRSEIELDEWIVMPNHLHGIVWITHNSDNRNVGATGRSPLRTLPIAMPVFPRLTLCNGMAIFRLTPL